MSFAQNLKEEEEQRLKLEAKMREKQIIEDFKAHQRLMNKDKKFKFRDPRKMLDKRFKDKIVPGGKLFDKNSHASRQGYLKLLSKIQDSNFTLRQVKNGCTTLFDKEFMKINYTNPNLINDSQRKAMVDYFEKTKPIRF